jgi:hypothetical protein
MRWPSAQQRCEEIVLNKNFGYEHPEHRHRYFIGDLDPAEILVALFNRARPKGSGEEQETPVLTLEEARNELKRYPGYAGADYLKGRAIKVNFDRKDGWLDCARYAQYHGLDEASYAIKEVAREKDPATRQGYRTKWVMVKV